MSVSFAHRLEYAAIRVVEAPLLLLPRSLAIRLGETIGVALSFVLRSRHRLILENLRQAFPGKNVEEIQRIRSAVWRNLGRTAVEFVRLPEFMRDWPHNAEVEGAAHVDAALALGNGVIMVTSHFANWELSGVIFQKRFGRMLAIARPIKNPLVERWVLSKRNAGGLFVVPHRQAVKACLRWLRGNGAIGMLVDQNLYTGGEFIDFLGRPAASTTLPALLHARTGAPVIHAYVERRGDGFCLVIEPPVVFPPVADDAARLRVHTQAVADRLAALIRRRPENWFWIHNRWKRQPPALPVSSATTERV